MPSTPADLLSRDAREEINCRIEPALSPLKMIDEQEPHHLVAVDLDDSDVDVVCEGEDAE